jgi:very-short-patch-repair endonuclease
MPFDISARIEAWRTLLLDTTKRNRLINFKTGGTGGIALAHPDPGDLWHCLVTNNHALTFAWKRDLIDLPPDPEEGRGSPLALFDPAEPLKPAGEQDILERCRRSPRLRPDHLLTDLTDRRLAARLTRLALNSRESLTEQGVATLYIAFGFLRWFESPESLVEVRSPLLLVPVRLERDSVEAPWRLQAEDEDVLPNYSLAQMLLKDFRLRLPAPEDDMTDADDAGWRTNYFGEVQRCVRHNPRWEVLDEAALGTFSFQKLAMWDDLGRNRDRIAAHDLCRAVAGDPAVALRCPADLPAAEELDRKAHPAETFHILDADSSQHEAIAAATRGASLVLDGPPGTGKSQTIANIIAESLAAGKTVLFVSEKSAALEVVQRRLQDKGLGDFCLACHSHKANKREVVAELSRCLGLGPESFSDASNELQRLHEARCKLNEYVRELRAARPPLGMTAYQVHGELSRLSHLESKSRCMVPQVLERDAAYLRRVVDLLAGLPDCRSVIAGPDRHPWRGCRAAVYSPTLRDDVCHHFGELGACLGRITEAAAALHQLDFCVSRPTRDQWRGAVETARTVLACPLVPAGWFQGDPSSVAEAVVQIDHLSQAYRRARISLPEFAPEALRRAKADSLSALTMPPNEPVFAPRPGETLRALHQRLANAGTALRELHTRALAVDQSVRTVGGLLRISVSSSPVKALRSLAELADLVARMGPVRRSWWDAGRRKELRGVLARCREEGRAAKEVRSELAARLSPRAFAPESAGLVARALRYRSLLARLLPGWRSLKAEASGWYTGEPPKTTALLDDLGKVAGYHRRIDYCREVREQYAADLLVDGEGKPDWDGTLEALRSLDRMEQLIPKIPADLQADLSSENGLDRPALAAAGRVLAEQVASLRQHLEAAKECDLSELTDGAPGQVRRSAQALAAWLEARAGAASRQTAFLERVSALLAEGRDLPAADLTEKARILNELGKLRTQIAGLCSRVWPGQSPPEGVEERDWSAFRSGSEALLRLLERWRGLLPAPVVRVLTTPDVRGRLTDAIRQSDAACAGGFEQSWQFLADLFSLSQPVSTGLTIEATPLADLRPWLTERAGDTHRLREWTQFCEVKWEITRAGVAPVLDEVLGGRVKPEEAGEAFRARFLRLWLDEVYKRVPALRLFATESHERLIGQFRELDRRAVVSASARIRALQLSRPDRPRLVAGDAPGSSELGVLLRQANMKRRHLPLRKLFAAIPNLLPRLKPCVMMSPLAVSTYLQSPDIRFDLVIFDEASQVRPHDAICAIYRGRQLIVAGDQKQLPPTSFFDRALEDDEASSEEDEAGGGGLEDFESVLDVCCTLGLPRRRLRWHYRSRREGLIAFSNRFFYSNELVTFPSVHDIAGNPAVAFEHVPDGRWKAGPSGGYNAVEARRTAELVLAHFRQSPDESLGVIAFSQRQQLRILDELEQLRRANPDLEEFFREDRAEPFFVKNLENVQGDERDVIFLGIGYGPDETGRVAMRFGPLNRQGGERRLNVAVTRARRRMAVVSSIRAHDIDLSRTGAYGAKLLRAYLDYAERGPEALPGAITGAGEHAFDSPFEQEVYEELNRRGLTVHPQVGCSGFRIDLAVVDPRAPGRYLLGVECDGATYHSSATARDRDRLRQEVLESLGWWICRIWSTDWLRDRLGQVQRVQAALEKAQHERAAPPRAPAAPETTPPAEGFSEKAAVRTVPVTSPATRSYASIEEVPEAVLRELLCSSLHTFGATEANELAQAVARQLGFKRTGRRIQARIEACLEGLIRAGQIRRAADQRLQMALPSRTATM